MHFSGSLMKTIWNVRISSNICSCVEGAGRGGRWGTCCRAAGVNFDDGSQLPGEHSLLCSATLFWSSNIKMSSAVCCMYLSDFGFFSLRHYFGIFISPPQVQSVSKCGGEPLVYVVQGGHGPRLIQTPPEGIILNKYTAEMSLYLGPTLKHLFLLPTLQGAELFKS